MSNKERARERAARVAAMRAEQKRKDRRRKYLIGGVTAAIFLGLVAAVAIPLLREARRPAEAAIQGVEEFEDLSAGHVTGAVEYAMSPPAGGDHDGVLQNCGVYDQPVRNETAVHSLEHGAVWITYSPDLAGEQVAALTDMVREEDYALLSPYEGLESPVLLSAWGVQLAVSDVADPRVEAFMSEYLQGPQTPEPGAPCFGGIGTPVT